MFAESERSSKIHLEDGLWFRVDADCNVDISKPKISWPKCANWMILSRGVEVKTSDSKPGDEPEDVFIVDGKPPLIQARIKTNGKDVAYGFLALKAQAYSAKGTVTDGKAWPVPCGIDEATEGAAPKVTPYPGFNKDCMPQSVDALRAAAAKGPAKGNDVVEWKWVRAETP